MRPEEQKIIFFNSYLPRTGHNFASEVLKVYTDHMVLPHNTSEIKLSTLINSFYDIYDGSRSPAAKRYLKRVFIENLRKNIPGNSSNNYIMIKDTSFIGVERMPALFPDDIHLLLVRDPMQVFSSLIKAMNLKERTFKNKVKQVGIRTGFFPYYYSRKRSKEVLRIVPDFKNHIVLRYEDLVSKDEKTLGLLKDLFNAEKSLLQIKNEIDKIQVINSSFYEEVNAESIWDMKPVTKNFNPLNRKGNSFAVRKGIELGSKKLRKKLNYI